MPRVESYLPFDSDWQMMPAERLALIALLDFLRPRCSLEVGSKYGGSLAILSHYSTRVISLDIDESVPQRLAHFTNAEFVIGKSQETLPGVLAELEQSDTALQFALIDGDHTTRGVRQDCECFLAYRPRSTLYVLMHDSFNPDVREGIRGVRWDRWPYVQAVELDFVPGIVFGDHTALHRQMWGGFALAVLGPEKRQGGLDAAGAGELGYRWLRRLSAHNTLVRRTMQVGRALGLTT